MPISNIEKSLSKYQKEHKKAVEQQIREEKRRLEEAEIVNTASTIVSGQPVISNVRIMDASSEEFFGIILDLYLKDPNDSHKISGDYNCFPDSFQFSTSLEFKKLTMYGVISPPQLYLGGWYTTITSKGLTYFEDKEKAMKDQKSIKANLSLLKKYDVFISHASKDKSDYVDQLYVALRRLGVSIFYDTDVISWGDNWKKTILDGTAASEFAIIVISENFFDREWTERELTEFMQRQNDNNQKIVLPLLHNITIEQFKNKYPELEEIQAIQTKDYNMDQIVILFAKELIKRYKGVS